MPLHQVARNEHVFLQLAHLLPSKDAMTAPPARCCRGCGLLMQGCCCRQASKAAVRAAQKAHQVALYQVACDEHVLLELAGRLACLLARKHVDGWVHLAWTIGAAAHLQTGRHLMLRECVRAGELGVAAVSDCDGCLAICTKQLSVCCSP